MQELGTFRIAADHPALPGHFPGHPIVPGVVLLDEVLALVLVVYPGLAAGLPQMKFLRPVLAEQIVTVSAKPKAADRVDVWASVDGQNVLRGSLSLGVS